MFRSALIAGLLASSAAAQAQAQQRQPANVSTLPQSSPQEFDLLDNTGKWMPFGTASGGAFKPFGGAGVDIRSFGAKCDGVTDDMAAINAAMSAVQTAGGGVVFIPPSMGGCRDTSTIHITASNVSLQGSQYGGSQIFFDNGGLDSVVVGNGRGSPTTYYNVIRDLFLRNTPTKTGGVTISLASAAQAIIQNVVIGNAWTGMSFDQINNTLVSFSTINGVTDSGGNGINFVTAGDGSVRSDVLTVSDTVMNMHATKPGPSEGIHIDGFSSDLRAKGVGILGAGSYGFHVLNTAGSNQYFPQFGEIYDLEIDGEYNEAIRIEAGNNFMFAHATVNSIRDTDPTHAIVEIFPDSSASITRQIYFTGSYISDGPGTCMRVNGMRDSLITGSTLADCGKNAGPNPVSGPQANPVPVLDIGAATLGLNVTGNILGYVYGQCCAGSNNYAVQVASGAARVLLGDNNYFLFSASTSSTAIVPPKTPINNLAGANLMMTTGGVDLDGTILGPRFIPAGPGGSDQWTMTNASTTTGTAACHGLATGTAGAFAQLCNIDGTTPKAVLSSGAGDAGGLVLSPGAGDVLMQPAAGNVVLWPTGSTNQVKFGNGGSFDATTSHCGSIAGSTGCLVIQDNTGAVRKVPYF